MSRQPFRRNVSKTSCVTASRAFGLRFGDTKETLIAKFDPPAANGIDIPPLRWDTERYALSGTTGRGGKLNRLSLQLPVVATNRPGFEVR
jgi:hypothetical protein